MVDRLAQIREGFVFKIIPVALAGLVTCTPPRDGRNTASSKCSIAPNVSSEDIWREINPQTGEETYILEAGGAITYPEGIIRNDSPGIKIKVYRERLHTLLKNPLFGINIPSNVMIISLFIPRSNIDPEAIRASEKFLQENRDKIFQGFELGEGKTPERSMGSIVSLEDIFKRFFIEDRQKYEDLSDLSRRLSLEWLISTRAAASGFMLNISEEAKEFVSKTPPLEFLEIDQCVLQRFGVVRTI